ncbi:prolipoprotein diacylglyceryl transferase [Candidatus Phycosocius spiralis]|uniref:Phosphatidylglycerol--prolipoprotein diacylglyceryl transferase n=1 Tax=Candidatus Phycosocius spiralis TaxID=2815099 RepID=A0ABQ4PWW4_9PROT|nr:prolipoprotein diacylglyceryl transferase [Candidatus Phycosocius spiralis]GIU67507.1 prolipoprotein diacylglyceryl transferase [Candidatus Phycosocius spiralis]
MLDLAIPFPDISPFVFQLPQLDLGGFTLGPFGLRWYALAYIAGLVLGWRMIVGLVNKPGLWGGVSPLNEEDIDDFLFYATLGVLLGGRIGYVMLYRPEMLSDPLSVLRVWEGGMSFHGGFLGVCLAVIGVALARRKSILALGDAVAVGAPIGQFFGRIANFINQELWGRPTDVSWAFIFKSDPDALARHPSQLYQAGLEGIVLFLILQIGVARFKMLHRPGLATGVFITGYGVMRWIGEQFREPDASLILNLTRGEFYSLPMIIIGIGILIVVSLRKPNSQSNPSA